MSSSQRQRRLRDRYEQLLHPKRVFDEPAVRLEKLRRLVVLEGIPPESTRERSVHTSRCSLRGRVWKIMLGVKSVDSERYGRLIGKGPARAEMEEKIEKDIRRTLKNNKDYHKRVPDDQLRRILNAYVVSRSEPTGTIYTKRFHESRENSKDRTINARSHKNKASGEDGLYVQGMNVLAAPFLYVMNELDAFCSLERLLTHHCPLYVANDLRGAQRAARLLEEVLSYLDPELSAHLDKAYGTPHWGPVTSLPHLLSLSASKPAPLPATLELWDVLFACGVHMNVIFLAAQMILARDSLMGSSEDSSGTTLAELQNMLFECKGMPPLNPGLIITLSMHLLRKLPDDLYDRLVFHPYAEPEAVAEETRRIVASASGRVKAGRVARMAKAKKALARAQARGKRSGPTFVSQSKATETSQSSLNPNDARRALQGARLTHALHARKAKIEAAPPKAPSNDELIRPLEAPRGSKLRSAPGVGADQCEQEFDLRQQERRAFLLRRARHYHMQQSKAQNKS